MLETEVQEDNQTFELLKVLEESEDGRNVMKFYKARRMILPKHQKQLVKLIIDKVFLIKKKLSVEERFAIARDISLVFLTEPSVHTV